MTVRAVRLKRLIDWLNNWSPIIYFCYKHEKVSLVTKISKVDLICPWDMWQCWWKNMTNKMWHRRRKTQQTDNWHDIKQLHGAHNIRSSGDDWWLDYVSEGVLWAVCLDVFMEAYLFVNMQSDTLRVTSHKWEMLDWSHKVYRENTALSIKILSHCFPEACC